MEVGKLNYDQARRVVWKLMEENQFFTLHALEKRIGWDADEVAFLLRDMGFDTTRARIKPGGTPARLWAKPDLIQKHRTQREPLHRLGMNVLAD